MNINLAKELLQLNHCRVGQCCATVPILLSIGIFGRVQPRNSHRRPKMQLSRYRFLLPRFISAALIATAVLTVPAGAEPSRTFEVPVFQLALAESATQFEEIYAYYVDSGFNPIWVGNEDKKVGRRQAFLSALGSSSAHGIPLGNLRKRKIEDLLSEIDDLPSAAAAEVEISSEFVQFARELDPGNLNSIRERTERIRC